MFRQTAGSRLNTSKVLFDSFSFKNGDIALPRDGRVIRAADFPVLARMKGRTLITADGSTLLGADDKAGIAEIMTLCEELIRERSQCQRG